jgi:large subunit ribosomal protein L4
LARKSALSLKANEEAIIITQNFEFDEPKTKQVVEILEAFELSGKKVLFLTAETDKILYLSARNIPGVSVLEANKPTTYEIMNADVLVIQEGAVGVLEETFEPKVEEEAA